MPREIRRLEDPHRLLLHKRGQFQSLTVYVHFKSIHFYAHNFKFKAHMYVTNNNMYIYIEI
jgi:hypothetical protein